MTPRTGAERQRACDDRKRKAGYKQIRNLWILPEHEQAVRNYVALLLVKHGMATKGKA